MYTIRFKKSAEKELYKLSNQVIIKIVDMIDSLSESPRPFGSKKLVGQNEVLWRVRVGDYRIVYSINDIIEIIEIRRIAHRKDVYK